MNIPYQHASPLQMSPLQPPKVHEDHGHFQRPCAPHPNPNLNAENLHEVHAQANRIRIRVEILGKWGIYYLSLSSKFLMFWFVVLCQSNVWNCVATLPGMHSRGLIEPIWKGFGSLECLEENLSPPLLKCLEKRFSSCHLPWGMERQRLDRTNSSSSEARKRSKVGSHMPLLGFKDCLSAARIATIPRMETPGICSPKKSCKGFWKREFYCRVLVGGFEIIWGWMPISFV